MPKLPVSNYTHSPNVLYDEIFKTLKEGELRVILVLTRQTFGWHKCADRISLSQLSEKSGMERRSVCRSLASLIEKGLVIKKKFGVLGRERCYYALNMEEMEQEHLSELDGIETEEDELIFSNNLDQCPKDTRPVTERHYPSDLKTPTKETNTKETIQKKQQQEAPKNLAAVSLKKKNPEPVKIYECLKSIDIPEYDKIEITRMYVESIVIECLVWATHETTKIKCLAAAIKWGCKTGKGSKDIKLIVVDPIEERKEFAKKHIELAKNKVDIQLRKDHVELSKDGQGFYKVISYAEMKFKEKFCFYMKQLGIMTI